MSLSRAPRWPVAFAAMLLCSAICGLPKEVWRWKTSDERVLMAATAYFAILAMAESFHSRITRRVMGYLPAFMARHAARLAQRSRDAADVGPP